MKKSKSEKNRKLRVIHWKKHIFNMKNKPSKKLFQKLIQNCWITSELVKAIQDYINHVFKNYLKKNQLNNFLDGVQKIKNKKIGTLTMITAPFEADPQLVYLEKIKLIDLIISNDSDMILYGAKTVMFSLNENFTGLLYQFNKTHIEQYFQMKEYSNDIFLLTNIIKGCDFWKCVHLKSFVKIVSFVQIVFNNNDILNQIKNHFKINEKNIERLPFAYIAIKYAKVFCPINKNITSLNYFPSKIKSQFNIESTFQPKFNKNIKNESELKFEQICFSKVKSKTNNFNFLGLPFTQEIDVFNIINNEIDPYNKKKFNFIYNKRGTQSPYFFLFKMISDLKKKNLINIEEEEKKKDKLNWVLQSGDEHIDRSFFNSTMKDFESMSAFSSRKTSETLSYSCIKPSAQLNKKSYFINSNESKKRTSYCLDLKNKETKVNLKNIKFVLNENESKELFYSDKKKQNEVFYDYNIIFKNKLWLLEHKNKRKMTWDESDSRSQIFQNFKQQSSFKKKSILLFQD